MVLPFDPQKEIFSWGPIPGKFFFVSAFIYANMQTFRDRYPGFGWPLSLFLFQNDAMVFFCFFLMNHYFAPNALEAHIQDISNELVQEKKEFDEAVQLFKDAKTYTTEDRGGSVQNYHYYIYPFKGIALSNFRLLQTLSSHLGKMVAPETEVILTVETDGISVAAFVAASLGLPQR